MNFKQKNTLELKSNIQNCNLTEMPTIIKNKIQKIQEIIQYTITSIQLYKTYQIYSNSDVMFCLTELNELYIKSQILYDSIHNIDESINKLQLIVDKLSIIISNYGTTHLEDLLFIIFGSEFTPQLNRGIHAHKYGLIKRFVHPINYKIIQWKQINKQSAVERNIEPPILCKNKMESDIQNLALAPNLECFNIEQSIVNIYYLNVYGLQLVIHNEKLQKTIIIQCICDDVSMDCISNQYISDRIAELNRLPIHTDISIMPRIIDTLTIKDLLIYGPQDISKRLILMDIDIQMVLNNKIDFIIKKFCEMDMYSQRGLLMNMLIYNKNDEVQYITYLLYDLITNPNENADSPEQILLYNSFPLKIKMLFKEAMKYTIVYSQNMMKKYDTNLITLEQKIFLLKVPENVKERAMTKYKELKNKNDETGTKTKQYLEGLLKIPFGIYKCEPILNIIHQINLDFSKLIHKKNEFIVETITKKPKYTNIEISKYLEQIRNQIFKLNIKPYTESILLKHIQDVCNYINSKPDNQLGKIKGKTKTEKYQNIIKYNGHAALTIPEKCKIYDLLNPTIDTISDIYQDYTKLTESIKTVESSMTKIIDVLDESIYGHDYAKNQILKIVGQWMNGKQNGYCFGFEGSPGIGKTSLAKKGLSYCLKDENGQYRPFAFIALGGSCNGSTLEGHSYTYVNSIWGRIVDILMETKCMNPIIYIDELDKVSKTEHGKEIIGILTHMIDSTQNNGFQDKYFSGIDIDLSKVLFIFSYNDPEQIDRILLDRIHRIKFDNLSISDKLVIVNKYIIPEILQNMGLSDDIIILDNAITEYIIEYYTIEPGIRKLKEILFDIYGEINLEILQCKNIQLPIHLTVELLKTQYLKKYNQINEKMINPCSEVGIVNGLWANSLGKGGIIPIETVFFPSSSFLELKLTGLQGDVMKESMNVAKSLAWLLTPDIRKTELLKWFDDTRNNGIHIHCPDGAVSKDGPSAGGAITIAIYSLLNNKHIKNTVAMTGEIDLKGNITEIGGLDTKIMGGVRAGIETFIFPKANNTDFRDFIDKNTDVQPSANNTYIINTKLIAFIQVSHINDVFEHIYEKDNI